MFRRRVVSTGGIQGRLRVTAVGLCWTAVFAVAPPNEAVTGLGTDEHALAFFGVQVVDPPLGQSTAAMRWGKRVADLAGLKHWRYTSRANSPALFQAGEVVASVVAVNVLDTVSFVFVIVPNSSLSTVANLRWSWCITHIDCSAFRDAFRSRDESVASCDAFHGFLAPTGMLVKIPLTLPSTVGTSNFSFLEQAE